MRCCSCGVLSLPLLSLSFLVLLIASPPHLTAAFSTHAASITPRRQLSRLHFMALPVAQPADLKSRIAKLRSTLLFLNDKMRESVSDEKKDDHCRLRDAVARSFTPESSLPGHTELREWLTANNYESRYGGNGLRRAIGTLEKELSASEKELRKRQRDEQQPHQPPQQQQGTKTGEADVDELAGAVAAAHQDAGEKEASTKRLRPALGPVVTAPRPTSNKLIICDMNQLLLYKYQKGENGPGVRGHKSKAIMRPFANEFLRTLSEKVHLALWTSGGRRNVANWEQIIFHGVPLVFRWYNDRCTVWKEPGTEAELCKPMERVWDEFPQFKPGNTVMIDDSPHKMRNNPPYSYFCPPPYRITFDNSTNPPRPIIPDDRALEPYKGELWLYLAALADYEGDCREFMLDYPYPTRPGSELAS